MRLSAAVLVALAAGIVIGVAVAASSLRRAARAETAVSLAVTPVQSAGAAADDQLAAALTTALLRELRTGRAGKDDRLRVIEWRPGMSYDRATRVVRSGGRPIAIDFVLEGGVEDSPVGARATFSLIRTETGQMSWTRGYPLREALREGAGSTGNGELERVARDVAEAARQVLPAIPPRERSLSHSAP